MSTDTRDLHELLRAAEAGEDVDPHEVAAAREAETIQRLKAEGEARRAAEAAEAERIAKQEALLRPLQKHLSRSEERIRDLNTAAHRAVLELLQAVDEHNRYIGTVADTVERAGLPSPHLPTSGYTYAIDLGGKRYSYWLPQHWANNLIAHINRKWPLNRGRWSRESVPTPIREIPQPDSP